MRNEIDKKIVNMIRNNEKVGNKNQVAIWQKARVLKNLQEVANKKFKFQEQPKAEWFFSD